MATYNDKAWFFVRTTKKPYTAKDLARVMEISPDFARKYLFYLQKVGYVKQVGKVKQNGEKIYRTTKITGVKTVAIDRRKKVVIDKNLNLEINIETLEERKHDRRSAKEKNIEFISSQKDFSLKEIERATKLNYTTIRLIIKELKSKGFITGGDKKSGYRYKLTKRIKEGV